MSPRTETAIRVFALTMVLVTFGSVSLAEAQWQRGAQVNGGDNSAAEMGRVCGRIFGLVLFGVVLIGGLKALLAMLSQQSRNSSDRGPRRPRRRSRRRYDDEDDDDDDFRSRGPRSVR